MNSYRNYTANTKAVSKNLEKLSSGYRINRAGDDAAGLAISEKMRAQITGLKTAQKNAKDGISLVQTAEGALTEVHSMLNRMLELADQSANGTYDDATDRANLQKEISQLKSEVDRIADSTNFNGIKLLDGSLAGGKTVDGSFGAAGKELMDVPINIVGGSIASSSGAAAVQGFDLSAMAASKVNAFEINFLDSEGVARKLVLAINGTAVGGSTAADDFMDALANGSFVLSSTDVDAQTTLEEFNKLFTVDIEDLDGSGAGGTNGLTIQAKDFGTKASITSIKIANASTAEDAITGLGSGTAIPGAPTINKLAESPGYKLTSAASATKALSISFGGKTYTSDTLIANSATKAEAATKELFAKLKADGFKVDLSEDKRSIIFTDKDQLKVAQKGVQIEKSDKFNVDSKTGTAGGASFKLNTPSAANSTKTFTFEYIDAKGATVKKELTYATGANATEATNNLKGLLQADEELSELFNVTSTNDVLTFTNKGTGTTGAQVKSMSTNDTAGFSSSITVGMDTGKTLSTGAALAKGDTITIDGKTYEFTDDANAAVSEGNHKVLLGTGTAGAANETSLKNLAKVLKDNGVETKGTGAGTTYELIFADNKASSDSSTGGGLTLQIGDTPESFNQLTIYVGDMHAKSLGIGDIDISTQEGGTAAIDKIKAAINSVSSTRGDLGAAQNRLDHTINNLSVMTENIQDAESAIRDVDVADEMMAYTKNNILVQSAQAMLAQANQLPQGVLQLLG